MHERGAVAQALANALRSEGPVTMVHVHVGPRADLDVVQQIWQELTAQTALDEVPITWHHERDELLCLGCGEAYPGTRLDPCPACGDDGLVVAAAEDITVTTDPLLEAV